MKNENLQYLAKALFGKDLVELSLGVLIVLGCDLGPEAIGQLAANQYAK